MQQAEQLSLEPIRGFLSASEAIRFESRHRAKRYAWVEQLLIQHQCATLSRRPSPRLHPTHQ